MQGIPLNPTLKLEELLRQGSIHVIFEHSDTLSFDLSEPEKRIVLKGVVRPDWSINEELASRMLSGVLYLYGEYKEGIKLEKTVAYNRKGEPSGELILDSKTGRVIGGYGWVDWKQYHIIPVVQEGIPPKWTLNANRGLLFILNHSEPEYAERALAEAQVIYDSRRAA